MTRGLATIGRAGLRGFDANATIGPDAARLMAAARYSFAARYIPRVTSRASDLSVHEIQDLFDVGLAVTPVQHVESEKSWIPTDDKGRAYGDMAAKAAHDLGVPAGTTVWVDVEGVADGVDAEAVIRYGNYWFDRVAAAGYEPGMYVGWHSRLTPEQLRKRLKFRLYWGAYNLNADEYPIECGLCMKQHEAKPADVPAGAGLAIDTDTISGDQLGRFPTLYAPEGW